MTKHKQKIVPHLWYDTEARDASEYYSSIFPHSKVTNVTVLPDTPSGNCDVVSFELWKHQFMAISAGPLFKFNPTLSFIVNFDPLQFGAEPTRERSARAKLDEVWEKLSDNGSVLIPIGEYPFSKRFGWIQDRYGLSWQLILTDPNGEPRPPVLPAILFVGEKCGKAEEARNFYLSVFKNSKPGSLHRYAAGQEPDREGSVMFSDFILENCWFVAMDSAHEHPFDFNEATSFVINCDSQEEVDYYWESLSAVPEAEQCGWIKDKYGVSWQIVPDEVDAMMRNGTKAQISRITQAFLKMKKLDLAALQRAYNDT